MVYAMCLNWNPTSEPVLGSDNDMRSRNRYKTSPCLAVMSIPSSKYTLNSAYKTIVNINIHSTLPTIAMSLLSNVCKQSFII